MTADSNNASDGYVKLLTSKAKRGIANMVLATSGAAVAIVTTAVNANPLKETVETVPKKVVTVTEEIPLGRPNPSRVQSQYPSGNDRTTEQQSGNYTQPYNFRTAFSTSYGKADVTSSVEFILPEDKRFTPRAKASFEDIQHSLTSLGSAARLGKLPDGLSNFKSSSLSQEEKAQVLGSVIFLLRANDSNAAQTIVYLAKSFPEMKNIQYVWIKPDNNDIPKPQLSAHTARITSPGTKVQGNLGEFLASAVQDKNKYTELDVHLPNYRLYAAKLDNGSLKFMDNGLSGAGISR